MEDDEADTVFHSMNLDAGRYPGKNTFDVFLELIAGFPLRSSFEYNDSEPFHSRWVSTQAGPGTAIRWSCAPHVTTRSENDVADSSATGYGILYALSGGARVIQDGREIEVKPGSGVIYDVDKPGHVNMPATGSGEYCFVTIPRHVAHASAPAELYRNPMRAITMRTPLLRCVDYLSGVLSRRSAQEVDQVYRACSSLFAAEFLIAQSEDASSPRSIRASADRFSRMLVLIDREVGNFALSPEWLAERLGISVRHVHKLFAREGLTCHSYITNLRLDYSRNDLLSFSQKIRIATLAYRWGFTDPSSFGRAFRNRFGCSPGQFQSTVRS